MNNILFGIMLIYSIINLCLTVLIMVINQMHEHEEKMGYYCLVFLFGLFMVSYSCIKDTFKRKNKDQEEIKCR